MTHLGKTKHLPEPKTKLTQLEQHLRHLEAQRLFHTRISDPIQFQRWLNDTYDAVEKMLDYAQHLRDAKTQAPAILANLAISIKHTEQAVADERSRLAKEREAEIARMSKGGHNKPSKSLPDPNRHLVERAIEVLIAQGMTRDAALALLHKH